jgi:hypothetical protein
MKGGERGRGIIQAECTRQGMRPTHTPRDRGETAWQGHSWAWNERVMQGEGEVGE